MKNLETILDVLDAQGITEVTFTAGQFDEEYNLSPDDKDWVTFHKSYYAPFITDKLEVCDKQSTAFPLYRDWYMTINYHA
jgi:hypothetical protein